MIDIEIIRGECMKKGIVLLLGILIMLPCRVGALNLAENAKSAILIEASTGTIIYEKNSHEKLAPASMTKMMSMLLIVEAIEDGKLSWNQMITTSENASSMGGSQILLETGEKMSVGDLFKGIAVASGNDAVVALSEAVAGTEEEFVNMMNQRAKELGLEDTNFKNPHGLDTANHYTSAYDMAMIAKELVRHEKVLEFTSIYEDYLREDQENKVWLVNTNKLVKFYDGMDGLKTGYTKEAGYCLTATAKRGDTRFITVVMGEEDTKTRNSETTSMMDYAFGQYEVEKVLDKKRTVGTVRVEKGKVDTIQLVPMDDVTILNKKSDQKKNSNYEVKTKTITAPIKKGEQVGELILEVDGEEKRTVPLTVQESIEKANLLEVYLSHVKSMLSGDLEI